MNRERLKNQEILKKAEEVVVERSNMIHIVVIMLLYMRITEEASEDLVLGSSFMTELSQDAYKTPRRISSTRLILYYNNQLLCFYL